MHSPTVLHFIEAERAHAARANLSTLYCDPEMPADAIDQVLKLRAATVSPPKVRGDVVVSHLELGWSVLPILVALRSLYPDCPMVQFVSPGGSFTDSGGAPVSATRKSVLSACFALFDRIVVASANDAANLRATGLAGEIPIIWTPPLKSRTPPKLLSKVADDRSSPRSCRAVVANVAGAAL